MRLARLVALLFGLLTFAMDGARAECPAPAGGWVPGCETNQLSALEPGFRDDVDALLATLKAEGHQPRVAATFRSADRQAFLYGVGRFFEAWGAAPMTRARAHQSCHNAQDAEGAPASLAVDIVPGPGAATVEEKARFFQALGRAARERHLAWGGAWAKKNPVWKRHGLGWDPGHVQARTCRW